MTRPGLSSGRARTAVTMLVVGFLAVDALGGAHSSPLAPVLPPGAGSPSWSRSLARWIGLDRLGPTALIVVSLLVLAVTVAAFAVLVLEARRGRASVRLVAWGSVAAVVLAVAGPVLLSRDVTSYVAYGRMQALHGANPYVHVPAEFPADPVTPFVSREWIRTTSVYGPVFSLAGDAVARVAGASVPGAVLAFKVMAGAALLLCLPLVGFATRRLRPGREALAVAVVGLNPVVIVHTVGGAHNDAVMALFVVAGAALAVLATRDVARWPVGWLALGATVALTLATLVKVVAVIPLAIWLWTLARRASGRRLATVAAHLLVVLVVSVALFAPYLAGRHTLAPILTPASRQGWASGPALVARGARALGRAIAGHAGATAGAAVVEALGIALFAVVLVRLLTRRHGGPGLVLWGTALLVFALAAPYLLPWYAIWFLPFAALLDDGLLSTALIVGGVLALTGIPAEPAVDPGAYHAMLVGVHDGAGALMLALLLVASIHVFRRRAPEP